MDNSLKSATTNKSNEFGGPISVFFFIIFAHVLVYYLWISATYYHGSVIYPSSIADSWLFLARMCQHIVDGAYPTTYAFVIYIGFFTFQLFLAWCMPGRWVRGLPIPAEGNIQYDYLCNSAVSWYVTIIVMLILHFTGLFSLTELIDQFGHLITVGIIVSDVFSLLLYVVPLLFHKQYNLSGNPIYDFFMGSMLNPRIGIVDLKLFSDIRPWMLLFFITVGLTIKQYKTYGTVTWPMIFILVAHGLYTNACMKGEECVPTAWDIVTEKCGWMIIFWNGIGVPFVYSFNAFYILENNPQYPFIFTILLFVMLFSAYYVWDTANSQKNRFRMQLRGTYVPRKTFPQLPWGTLKNPKYIKTANGGTLLVDGWYRYARKIHYTADIIMALTWGLCCGFSGILPYFYPAFFITIIIHRYYRDSKRMKKKYGSDWDEYCKTVPYKFIPFVY